jgi:hypothetical protein
MVPMMVEVLRATGTAETAEELSRRAATPDARILTASVDRLEGGVYLSVGSAVMSPQVFEKAFTFLDSLFLRTQSF